MKQKSGKMPPRPPKPYVLREGEVRTPDTPEFEPETLVEGSMPPKKVVPTRKSAPKKAVPKADETPVKRSVSKSATKS